LKKAFLILLSFIYLASSAGATVQLHYCMDKLVGAGMHDSESDQCDKCGMKKQDGCCKDKSKQVKLESDQKPASTFFISYYFPAIVQETSFDVFHSLYLENDSYSLPYSNGPPIHIGLQLYKYLRVFRI
jgi:hypothetical protein